MSAICPNPFCKNPDIDPFTPHGCQDRPTWTQPSSNSTPNSGCCGSPSCSLAGCSSLSDCSSSPCLCRPTGLSDNERDTDPMTPANASLAGLLSPPREVTGTTGQLLAIVATPKVNPDSRGSVRETYRASWFPTVPPVKQLVQSVSGPKVMRGMHLHRRQHDIWRFTEGRAVVRLHDTATGDYAMVQGDENVVIAIPPGISHGFYTKEGCTLVYALTNEYDGSDEFGWYPFDGLDRFRVDMFQPDYGWPTHHYNLVISERDLRAPRLADFKG